MFGSFDFGESYFADADVSLVVVLYVDAGVYTVTGSSADLLVERVILADAGVYTVSGAAVSLAFFSIETSRIALVTRETRLVLVFLEDRLALVDHENRIVFVLKEPI